MPYKLGIVGYGAMGRWHAEAIERVRGLHLHSVCDITPVCRKDAEKKHGCQTHSDLKPFLQDPELDGVVVATPSHAHVQPVLAALKVGKPVLCDKPLVQNEREAKRLFTAAEKAGVVLMTFQNRRFDPYYKAAKKVITDGKLGKLHDLRLSEWWYNDVMATFGVAGYRPGWRTEAAYGGGVLNDFGPHYVDQLLQLVPQRVTGVHCVLSARRWTMDSDDQFVLSIQFEEGIQAIIEVMMAAHVPMSTVWAITGSDGGFRWEDDAGHFYQRSARGKVKHKLIKPPTGEWDDFYRNFHDLLRGKAEPLVKPNETLRLLRVLDAARRSAVKGKVIPIEDIYAGGTSRRSAAGRRQ